MKRTMAIAITGLLPLLLPAGPADAQGLGGRRLGIAAYGGVSLPIGSFKTSAGTGWHAGAYLETALMSAIDIRLDGAFSRFAIKDLTTGTGTADFSSEVFLSTLDLELNMGPDSAAYPGDNSVSPWIIGGGGIYRFDFEGECVVGSCSDIDFASSAETHWGVNVGAGATVPLSGIRVFVEGQYHIVFPKSDQSGNLRMLLVSAGVKFR